MGKETSDGEFWAKEFYLPFAVSVLICTGIYVFHLQDVVMSLSWIQKLLWSAAFAVVVWASWKVIQSFRS